MTRIQSGPAASDRIISAAVALFSRQGYYRTGTRDIARLADVSEVTVFRYFERKEDIFFAALETSFRAIESRLDIFSRSPDARGPEEMLPKIVGLLVDVTTFSPQLWKLVAVAIMEIHGEAEDLCYRRLAPLLSAIASYLKTNIDNGKLRDLNPAIVTVAMALAVIAKPSISRYIEDSKLTQMTGREALDEYSSFWLKILIPAKPDPVLEPAV